MCENARFVRRVFSDDERDHILSSADQDLEIWAGWAAKEAAYKVVSKLRGEPPIFVHRLFEVRWDPGTAHATHPGSVPSPSRFGAVRYEGMSLPVEVRASPRDGHVHALSWHVVGQERASPNASRVAWTVERIERPDAPWSDRLEELERQLTERERDGVHSRLSAAVRIGARAEAADLLGVDSSRVEVVCRPGRTGRRPPMLLVDGAPASIDVSLSHDGPWIAWALAPVGT